MIFRLLQYEGIKGVTAGNWTQDSLIASPIFNGQEVMEIFNLKMVVHLLS